MVEPKGGDEGAVLGARDEGSELDAALDRIRKRVAERRASGELPPGLEDQLDRHYRSMVSQMVTEQRVVAGLHDAVESLDGAPEFSRGRISYASRSVWGRIFHRVWGKLSVRQTEGILEQMRDYTTLVRRAVDRMSAVVESLAVHGHPDTERRVATLADRLSELEQRTTRLEAGGAGSGAASDEQR